MNEFERDPEKPYKPAGGWISCSSCPVETSMLEAVNGKPAATERGRDFHSAAAKHVGNETTATNAVMQGNPYPSVLVGIGAGALLGHLVARRLNARSG